MMVPKDVSISPAARRQGFAKYLSLEHQVEYWSKVRERLMRRCKTNLLQRLLRVLLDRDDGQLHSDAKLWMCDVGLLVT